MVAVAETLLGRGYELHIYDPQLNLSRLIGANQAEINRRMPHLAALLRRSPAEVVEQSEVILAAQRCARLDELAAHARAEHHLIDVNDWPELKSLPWHYEGICW
jgi:GDP-mannose 6-dehydrogenase